MGVRTGLGVVLVAAVAATGAALGAGWGGGATRAVCAEFDTTYGLYEGAAVTIRGVPVGSVAALEPAGDRVRVRMRIAERRLPAEVRAVVVNASLLTDRRVELANADYAGGALLPEQRCIAKERTETPLSVSAALRSFTGLLDEMTRPGPDGVPPLQAVLAGADRELGGLGPQLRDQLRALAELTSSPEVFMGELGAVLDNSAELTTFLTREWGDITTTLTTFGPGLELLESSLVIVKTMVGKLALAVEPMDRLFNQHFPYLMELLESSIPAVTLARVRAEESRDVLDTVPGVLAMLRAMVGVAGVEVGYRGPGVVVAGDPARLCAGVPECTALSAAAARMPLPQAVLAAVGGAR
ncbi:MlaD family protein [Nocardia asteroides]|uniref:MlaD family protein n=1 Tax=Nocardia asteroides TaxID=1824 RepID=UPI001E5D2A11|nr:MlaD family protein [Nocardia asteroides]UGT60931.1 MlaD family protein [Nocardia asteroides]